MTATFHNTIYCFIMPLWACKCCTLLNALIYSTCTFFWSNAVNKQRLMTNGSVKLTVSRLNSDIFRSSHLQVFCKKDVLRNFAKVTGKQLCQSLFFNKVAGLWPATLLTRSTRLCIRLSPPSTPATLFKKKKTLAQVFSYEFCEISKNTFFHRTPLMAASENRCS